MSDEIVEWLFSFFAGMLEPRFVRLVETWLIVGRHRQTDWCRADSVVWWHISAGMWSHCVIWDQLCLLCTDPQCGILDWMIAQVIPLLHTSTSHLSFGNAYRRLLGKILSLRDGQVVVKAVFRLLKWKYRTDKYSVASKSLLLCISV